MYQLNPVLQESLLSDAIYKAAKENPFKFMIARKKVGAKTAEDVIRIAEEKIAQAKATMPPEKFAFYEKNITDAVQQYMVDSNLMKLVSTVKGLF